MTVCDDSVLGAGCSRSKQSTLRCQEMAQKRSKIGARGLNQCSLAECVGELVWSSIIQKKGHNLRVVPEHYAAQILCA